MSTDTTALRELSWTLSAYGYQAVTSSDWSEQAPWQRATAPALVILDARDEQQIQAALAATRSTPYTYRVALYDANLLTNPDVLMDSGADDLVRYPLNVGELISCIRRGARRLEFERRFKLSTTFDQQSGISNQRGFTLQLDRKLRDKDGAANNALVVLQIDFLETIGDQHGAVAVENTCALVAEVLLDRLSPQDCRGILEEGIFSVLLQGKSISEGLLFAEEANEQLASGIGKGIQISLSGVVLGWPSGDTAEGTIRRAMSAIEHVRGWGGNQFLDVSEVERDYSAWQQKFTARQATDARHVMEALPLVLPLHAAVPASSLGVYSFQSGQLPPCVPVVDDVGHLVGVVDVEMFRTRGKDVFSALDEHLEPVSVTLRGDSRLDDIAASLDSADTDYLLVVENKKPIGYVTNETVAALRTKAGGDPSSQQFAAANCGLSSLVVPLV